MDAIRVLAVDDEPGMRLGMARTLDDFVATFPDVEGETRFQTDVAGSGEEALEKIGQSAPEIVLLDHKMPGMTGLEVIARLRETHPDILIIMITAYASLETAVSAIKRGAYDFLAKPFTPSELRETVRKAAGRLILQQQVKQLAEERRQTRFNFIRVLGHELKAPLAAIDGYLSIIEARTLGEDLSTYDRMVERCKVRVEGMRKLIADLLDLTRIEAGQKRRELHDVDLCEVARAAVETALPVAEERHILIALDCQSPLVMKADRGELEIILNNLVSNAVKYNRDGGRVDVTIRARGAEVVIAVSDTGIGLTADESAKLFNDFARIRNEKTRDILGSGLGLSTVKKLAHLYGGDVGVASMVDEGSTFTVRLRRAGHGPADQETADVTLTFFDEADSQAKDD